MYAEKFRQHEKLHEELYGVAKETFSKLQDAGVVGINYSSERDFYEAKSHYFSEFGVDGNDLILAGEDYHCGETEQSSIRMPLSVMDNLDRLDNFIAHRQAELKEQKELRELAKEDAKRKAAALTEEQERTTYARLKVKFEGKVPDAISA